MARTTLGNLSRLFIYQLERGSYVDDIRSINDSGRPWNQIKDNFDKSDYARLKPLIEHMFCAPCTSAPVERVFSHGGLVVRPHFARLGDKRYSI